jgi:hypothetical protein
MEGSGFGVQEQKELSKTSRKVAFDPHIFNAEAQRRKDAEDQQFVLKVW